MSSGVEGVTGDGERERVREGEEGDMGEIKKTKGGSLPATLALNAEEMRLASDGTTYSTYDDKGVSYAVIYM